MKARPRFKEIFKIINDSGLNEESFVLQKKSATNSTNSVNDTLATRDLATHGVNMHLNLTTCITPATSHCSCGKLFPPENSSRSAVRFSEKNLIKSAQSSRRVEVVDRNDDGQTHKNKTDPEISFFTMIEESNEKEKNSNTSSINWNDVETGSEKTSYKPSYISISPRKSCLKTSASSKRSSFQSSYNVRHMSFCSCGDNIPNEQIRMESVKNIILQARSSLRQKKVIVFTKISNKSAVIGSLFETEPKEVFLDFLGAEKQQLKTNIIFYCWNCGRNVSDEYRHIRTIFLQRYLCRYYF